MEKGNNYRDLKKSFIIFVCTFDLFNEGRHISTFENRCLQNPELGLGDDTTKIILNTKGTMNDVTSGMKKLLDFIDVKEPEDISLYSGLTLEQVLELMKELQLL